MKKMIVALALGFHRLLLSALLVAVALAAFTFGPVVGLIAVWLCLVLVAIVWKPRHL